MTVILHRYQYDRSVAVFRLGLAEREEIKSAFKMHKIEPVMNRPSMLIVEKNREEIISFDVSGLSFKGIDKKEEKLKRVYKERDGYSIVPYYEEARPIEFIVGVAEVDPPSL